MKKTNVLLLVIDCLRADHVYEPGHARTPVIDRLRAEGLSFLNTISCTSTTTPSFAGLLTGKYPFENGVRSHSGRRLSESVPTLADIARQNGYHTYAEVTGPLGREVGLDRGFDEYRHREGPSGVGYDWAREMLGAFGSRFVEPWFLLLHIWDLHRPRYVLPECARPECGTTSYGRALSSVDTYLGSLFAQLPENTLIVLTGDHGEEFSPGGLRGEWGKLRKRLYRLMRKRGLTRRHPSHALRGIRDGHGHAIYDVLVKVPLVFHCKGLIHAGRSELQVRHIDVLPTVLEAAGLDLPSAVTGKSLMGIARGKGGAHRDAYLEAVGTALPDRAEWLSGIRVDNRYKYIYAPYIDAFEPELYDLAADPLERRNIALREPRIAAALGAKIEALDTEAMVGAEMSEDDRKVVTKRLQDLGYID